MYSNIPYKLIGGVQFYKRKEVKDMIAYLRLCLNENDEVSLLRVINVPTRGIGDTSVEKLRTTASEKGVSMYSLLKDASEAGVMKSVASKMRSFYDIIENAKKEENPKSMLIYFKTKIGYLEDVENQEGIDIKIERESNIDELINKAAEFVERDEENALDSLNNFLNEVSLVSDIDDYDPNAEKLTLMTVHASKGLEFDNIYIVGFSQGLFPSALALLDSEEGVEEERRLAYVAMTRAKKKLRISSAVSKFFQGKSAVYTPSQFVSEAEGDGFVAKYTKTAANAYEYGDDSVRYNRFTDSYGIRQSKKSYDSSSNTIAKDVIKAAKADLSKFKSHTTYRKPSSLPYKVGDKVSHIKFGEGIVKNINDIGKDYEVTIEFKESGDRILLAGFAKLNKID
jgi:DNA helicase-2/ATP-dependent DNA helicase PcrA